jgi:hypothetical protein
MKDTRSDEEIQAANSCLKAELENAIAFFKSENYYGDDICLLHMALKKGRALLRQIERLEKRNKYLVEKRLILANKLYENKRNSE